RATIPGSVAIQSHLADRLPDVLADATQVHQIILNLGINAWQAMPAGRGRLEVGLEEVLLAANAAELPADLRPGRYVRLSVSDNGKGMESSVLDHIFEPFFTTKPAGE